MPLDAARRWLSGVDRYVRGETVAVVGGSHILESDRTWAAMLSLADAQEFLTQARRLSWEFEVRGKENLAPLQRYGDAVLDWIADRIDADGTLHNRPWCLLPCLLACPVPAAFEVAARVRAVAGEHDLGVLARWVLRHPGPGYRRLAKRAEERFAPAVDTLRELHEVDPRGTVQALVAVGHERVLARLGLTVEPLPDAVVAAFAAAPSVSAAAGSPVSLAELDDCFTEFEAPMWDNANYFCAAMRLTGYVNPGGTDGLVFQSLVTGLGAGDVRLEFATFGFDTEPGMRWGADREVLDETQAEGIRSGGPVTLDLPGGPVEVMPEPHPHFGHELGPREAVMLAVTANKAGRDRAFLDAGQLVAHLTLPAAADALLTMDNWDHPAAGDPASGSDDLVLAVEALRQRRASKGPHRR